MRIGIDKFEKIAKTNTMPSNEIAGLTVAAESLAASIAARKATLDKVATEDRPEYQRTIDLETARLAEVGEAIKSLLQTEKPAPIQPTK